MNRQDDQAFKETHPQSSRHTDRQDREEVAHRSRHQQHRQKGSDGRQRGRTDGNKDFLHSLDHRIHRSFAQLPLPADIFQNDDGIVDDDAHRQHKADEADLIDALPHHFEGNKGSQECKNDATDSEYR